VIPWCPERLPSNKATKQLLDLRFPQRWLWKVSEDRPFRRKSCWRVSLLQYTTGYSRLWAGKEGNGFDLLSEWVKTENNAPTASEPKSVGGKIYWAYGSWWKLLICNCINLVRISRFDLCSGNSIIARPYFYTWSPAVPRKPASDQHHARWSDTNWHRFWVLKFIPECNLCGLISDYRFSWRWILILQSSGLLQYTTIFYQNTGCHLRILISQDNISLHEITVFWNMTPWCLMDRYQYLEEPIYQTAWRGIPKDRNLMQTIAIFIL
jgi:hypothetical protein